LFESALISPLPFRQVFDLQHVPDQPDGALALRRIHAMMMTITAPLITLEEQDLLDRYGIVRVDVPRYDVDGYHYSKLDEAVAQARRSRAAA